MYFVRAHEPHPFYRRVRPGPPLSRVPKLQLHVDSLSYFLLKNTSDFWTQLNEEVGEGEVEVEGEGGEKEISCLANFIIAVYCVLYIIIWKT